MRLINHSIGMQRRDRFPRRGDGSSPAAHCFRIPPVLGLVVAWMCLAGALLAAGAEPASSAPTGSVHFYFVQITDTHLGDADHLERLKRIVEAIGRLPVRVECVVHTGDIVADKIEDPATVDAGRTLLQTLKIPVHYIPGNHDILASRPSETAQAYEKNFGPLETKAEYHGVVFLFLYTEPLRVHVPLEGFDPLKWLETELDEARPKPVLVFTHAPSVEDFYNNVFHRGWKKDPKAKWEETDRFAQRQGGHCRPFPPGRVPLDRRCTSVRLSSRGALLEPADGLPAVRIPRRQGELLDPVS